MKKAISKKIRSFSVENNKKVDIQSDNIALENYLTETEIELANLHNSNKYSKDKLLKIALHNYTQIKNSGKTHGTISVKASGQH